VYRSTKRNWRLALKALAALDMKVSRSTWYADLKQLDLEVPGWRSRDSDQNQTGLDDENCDSLQRQNPQGFRSRRPR
jgi:hypothetical protein